MNFFVEKKIPFVLLNASSSFLFYVKYMHKRYFIHIYLHLLYKSYIKFIFKSYIFTSLIIFINKFICFKSLELGDTVFINNLDCRVFDINKNTSELFFPIQMPVRHENGSW